MSKLIQDNYKRYLISSLVSFLTGFLLSISISLDQLTFENIGWSVLGGILFAGIRGGIKALVEYYLSVIKK